MGLSDLRHKEPGRIGLTRIDSWRTASAKGTFVRKGLSELVCQILKDVRTLAKIPHGNCQCCCNGINRRQRLASLPRPAVHASRYSTPGPPLVVLTERQGIPAPVF